MKQTNLTVNPARAASKHTPGPWYAADLIYRLDREGREFIGIGNGATHIGYASITACVRLSEAKANARLIASAPELLAERDALRVALTRLVEWDAYCEANADAGQSEAQLREDAMNAARAALAKVEGGKHD